MKTVLFLCLVGALIFTSCETDNKQVTSDLLNFPPSEGGESGENVPIMTFDSTTCNFGTLAIGEKVTHVYKFKNTGDLALVISQVTPSCGCTTPKDWPHEPVAPGQEGQITIEFNSTGFPGKIDKTISVLTNCIPKTIDLKLKGNVVGVEVKDDGVHTPIDMQRNR